LSIVGVLEAPNLMYIACFETLKIYLTDELLKKLEENKLITINKVTLHVKT